MREWLPYCGEAPHPQGWLGHWNLAPELLFVIAGSLCAVFLLRGGVRRRPAFAAVAIFAFVFVSPFCALGSALFTVRVIHDVVLVSVLAPLLVAAVRLERRRIAGSLPLWTVVHALVFWLWHAPPLYETAMGSDAAFWAMQASLAGTAAIWWAKVVRASAPAAVSALLATMVAMGTLGALLTFAPRAFYAPHWLTVQRWGFTPLEDQQVAGIVMWAPASLIYLLMALLIVYRATGQRAPA